MLPKHWAQYSLTLAFWEESNETREERRTAFSLLSTLCSHLDHNLIIKRRAVPTGCAGERRLLLCMQRRRLAVLFSNAAWPFNMQGGEAERKKNFEFRLKSCNRHECGRRVIFSKLPPQFAIKTADWSILFSLWFPPEAVWVWSKIRKKFQWMSGF